MLRKSRDVFVYNKTKETFLAFRVRVADSVLSRLIGLLGKRSLKPDSGVWIVPSNAIHTFGMLFTFDVVMIDREFKVVGVRELFRPFRILWPNLRAESIIELPAHAIFKSHTEIGDQLVIDRYESKKVPRADAAKAPLVSECHVDARASVATLTPRDNAQFPKVLIRKKPIATGPSHKSSS